MSSCAVNASMPMCRPAGLTRTGSVTPENTASWPTRRFRRRAHHQGQQLTPPWTSTSYRGEWVSHLAADTGLPLCGDRERPFPRKPTPGKRPDMPPAARRRLQPTTTRQQMRRPAAVLPWKRESDRVRHRALTVYLRRCQKFSFRGSVCRLRHLH